MQARWRLQQKHYKISAYAKRENFYIFIPRSSNVVFNSFLLPERNNLSIGKVLLCVWVWRKSTAGKKGGLFVSDWVIERENEMKTNYMIVATHTNTYIILDPYSSFSTCSYNSSSSFSSEVFTLTMTSWVIVC